MLPRSLRWALGSHRSGEGPEALAVGLGKSVILMDSW